MSFTYDGWTVNKAKVAYYAFGDKTQTAQVDDFVCEDAINLLKSELEMQRAGLSSSASKTDSQLNQAAVFFACHLLVKAGVATIRSGVIQSESLEGKSVSYAQINTKQLKYNYEQPQDWYGMAKDLILKYAEKHISATKGISVSVKNYRDNLFRDVTDKYGIS